MQNGLERFLSAQQNTYQNALSEIKSGRKRSHWIWYIFPQIIGLGYTQNAQYYGIKNLQEAKEYMYHPVLGNRLIEISAALLSLNTRDPLAVMGSPDDLKLRSSMTLFSIAAPEYDVFSKVLEQYYDGRQDQRTIRILSEQKKEI